MVANPAEDKSPDPSWPLTGVMILRYAGVMVRHLTSFVVTLVVAVAAATGGYVATWPAPEVLRLGVSAWPGSEPLFLAQDANLFTAAGISVELIEYASFADVAGAYARGDVDAMVGTMHDLIAVLVRSHRQPVVVRVTDRSYGADQWLACSDIANLADLAGRRIGVEVASVGPEILHYALASVGLDESDVIVVPSEPAGMAEAMTAGTVDAVVTYQPYASAVPASDGRLLFSSADLAEPILDALMIDRDYLRRNPNAAAAVPRAFTAAQARIAQDPGQSYADMGRRLGLSGPEFKAIYAQVRPVGAAEDRALRQSGAVLAAAARTAALLRCLAMIDDVELAGVVHDDG